MKFFFQKCMIALLLLQCFFAVEGATLCIKNGESAYEIAAECCDSEHVVVANLKRSQCEQCDECEKSYFQDILPSNSRPSVQNKMAEGFDTLSLVSFNKLPDRWNQNRAFLQTQNPNRKTLSTSLIKNIILII